MDKMSKRLTHYRKQRGLSMVEVAKMIEVPVSTYREWEYGREIKGEPYVKIARAFGVTLTELVTGDTATHAKLLQAVRNTRQSTLELEELVASL